MSTRNFASFSLPWLAAALGYFWIDLHLSGKACYIVLDAASAAALLA